MELSNALTTTTEAPGHALMTRSGRSTLIVLSARTHPMFALDMILPKMAMTTMNPSMQFQASRRYESLSSKYSPNAVSFIPISAAKMSVKTMSTASNASAVDWFSIAFGDSNAISERS